MKITKQFLIAIFLLYSFLGYGQNCEVKTANLQGKYEGDCKKGLADGNGFAQGVDTYKGEFKKGLPNGKGIYAWANGDIYDGEWKDGLRDGDGTWKSSIENKEKTGYWKKDVFIGKKYEKPRISNARGISSYKFTKTGEGNKITILITRTNAPLPISNWDLTYTSGFELNNTNGTVRGVDQVSFPVTCKFSFVYQNLLGTSMIDASGEFTIQEPGNWELEIKE